MSARINEDGEVSEKRAQCTKANIYTMCQDPLKASLEGPLKEGSPREQTGWGHNPQKPIRKMDSYRQQIKKKKKKKKKKRTSPCSSIPQIRANHLNLNGRQKEGQADETTSQKEAPGNFFFRTAFGEVVWMSMKEIKRSRGCKFSRKSKAPPRGGDPQENCKLGDRV